MNQSLPANFLWGNSVSSMQTEGAWNEGGKGMSVYDIREAGENISDWKVATDSYHRYREDFDLMQDLGMNCYRFQISWSRVCPQGDGDFNDEGIAFYDRFIDDLIARGIEPMVCLYHSICRWRWRRSTTDLTIVAWWRRLSATAKDDRLLR